MADARMRDEWARINALQCTVANIVGGKTTPSDFSPFRGPDDGGGSVQKLSAMVKALAASGKIPTIKRENR